jgi:hypothetical protein
VTPLSASSLRRLLHAAQRSRPGTHATEETYSRVPSVVYGEDPSGAHGNFLDASYRRIGADPAWSRRLAKLYTSSSRLPRQHDRLRGELECANSSDALLMNIFCYPRLTTRSQVLSLLGIDFGARPEFGVRANLSMRNGETDRTELDMVLGPLAVEAKLTETAFATASRQRVLRYLTLEEVFDLDELPWTPSGLGGYQLVRGVLAAHQQGRRFLLLCDGRRADLQETWFHVLRAVKHADVRSRMALLSWQELAAVAPPTLQRFLAEKYGILPA